MVPSPHRGLQPGRLVHAEHLLQVRARGTGEEGRPAQSLLGLHGSINTDDDPVVGGLVDAHCGCSFRNCPVGETLPARGRVGVRAANPPMMVVTSSIEAAAGRNQVYPELANWTQRW